MGLPPLRHGPDTGVGGAISYDIKRRFGLPSIPGYSLFIPFDVGHGAAPQYSLNSIATPTPTVDADGTYLNLSGVVTQATLNTLRVGRFTTALNKPGAIIEPTRTNYTKKSEDFTAWTIFPALPAAVTVTPNTTVAPDGAMTADTVTDSASSSSNEGRLIQSGDLASAANTIYTGSVFVKEGTATSFSIGIWDSTAGAWVSRADFEWSGGVCVVKAADIGTAKVIPTGTGWYRVCSIISGITTGKTLQLAVAPTEVGVDDDGKTTIFWGGMLEPVGPGPTSYIPTNAAAVERAADQLSYASDDLGTGDLTIYGAFCLPFAEGESDDDHYLLDSRNGSSVGLAVSHVKASNYWGFLSADGANFNLYTVADAALAVAANTWYGFAFSIGATGPTVVAKMRDLTTPGVDVSASKLVGPAIPPSAHGGLDIGKIFSGVNDILAGCIKDLVVYPSAHDATQIGIMLDWLQARAA